MSGHEKFFLHYWKTKDVEMYIEHNLVSSITLKSGFEKSISPSSNEMERTIFGYRLVDMLWHQI